MLKDYYRFASNNPHFLMFGLLTAFFGNYGQTFFIAWYGESFQKAFDLSSSEYGLIYSIATLSSGFIILYAGALLDKTPLKKFTFITSTGLIAACFLLFFSSEIWHLILAIFLLRFCGQGLMTHIAFTSMARYFNKNRGKAIGIVGFGMPLGEAVLPFIAVILINLIGWRQSWLVLGLVLIIFYWPMLNFLLVKSAERLKQLTQSASQNDSASANSWSRQQVIKDNCFWLLLPAIMAPAFIVTGIFIHQNILLQSKSWSGEWFAFCFIVYAVSHLKSSLVIGSLVDKYSGKRLIRFYLFPMFAGISLLTLPFDHQLFAAAFMFLTGLTIGASGPIVGSLWVEIYGNRHIGAIRSMVTSIMVVSTAISPVLFGWLLDSIFSYQQLLLCLLVYLFAAWGVVESIVLRKIKLRTENPRTT
ncbi:MFS transporter [Aliikangiella coralliicola]|uniref:MFS transporter n=1 Tax=Aliikangiella coralliicola TaxID=2592383 RepID=A0A545UE32_9GAMM|nr:MFS transporter [Aliikangiella coralliicola]TQV87726.1 MFS transporter [Aliikangiella coralliicola]